MIRRINESKRTIVACMGLVFLTMLVLNILTVMVVDDYIYAFSFATNERITSVWQIFPSMKQHYFTMNGRLLSHFMVQVLLILPPLVFDILNAGMFCLLVGIIYYFCCYASLRKHNAFLFLVIAGMLWKYVPAFGHVFLWLDGSVNYLWSTVYVLLYISPLIQIWQGKKVLCKVWQKTFYVAMGLLIGALSESMSMAAMAALLFGIFVQKLSGQYKVDKWIPAALFCCMSGYFFMMISPGTWKSKVEGSSSLIKNFLNVLEQYTDRLLALILLWIILMVWAWYARLAWSVRITALFYMIISIAINFLHVTANRYPARSMIGVTVFLIMADMFLLVQLWDTKIEVLVTMIGTIAIFSAGLAFFPGAYDILDTYRQCKAREEYILAEKEKGNLDLKIPLVTPETPYSALNGLRYLKCGTWSDWPNVYMAGYYGVNSIEGIKEKN